MRKINFPEGTMHLSEEVYSDVIRPLEKEGIDIHQLCYNPIKDFFQSNSEESGVLSPEYISYIRLFSRFTNKKSISLLEAHGGTVNGEWVYFDCDEKFHKVKNWVRRNEENNHGLIINVCNPDAHLIKSKKSILVYPNSDVIVNYNGVAVGGNFNDDEFYNHDNRSGGFYDFWSPLANNGDGGLIGSYVIGSELKDLEKLVKKHRKK